MLIFDGDYPMAPARDVSSAATSRCRSTSCARATATTRTSRIASLPEMRKAGMAVAILKVVSDMQREGNTING